MQQRKNLNPLVVVIVVLVVLVAAGFAWVRYSSPPGQQGGSTLIQAEKLRTLTPAERKASEEVVKEGLAKTTKPAAR